MKRWGLLLLLLIGVVPAKAFALGSSECNSSTDSAKCSAGGADAGGGPGGGGGGGGGANGAPNLDNLNAEFPPDTSDPEGKANSLAKDELAKMNSSPGNMGMQAEARASQMINNNNASMANNAAFADRMNSQTQQSLAPAPPSSSNFGAVPTSPSTNFSSPFGQEAYQPSSLNNISLGSGPINVGPIGASIGAPIAIPTVDFSNNAQAGASASGAGANAAGAVADKLATDEPTINVNTGQNVVEIPTEEKPSFGGFSDTPASQPHPVKLIASKANGYDYGYGPSIIYAEGQWHMYYCSTGTGALDWDHIRHSSSNDLINWSTPDTVLASTNLERANCDPSIVQFNAGDGLYYYLVYSGNEKDVQTLNFVARSKSLSGRFLKYTERGTWEVNPQDPHPILWPKQNSADNSNIYGAGQASIVVKDGTIFQFYTDTTFSAPNFENRILVTQSTDFIHWSPAVPTNVQNASVDVKFDTVQKQFIMVEIINGHTPTASLSLRRSNDGIKWSDSSLICGKDCMPPWTNNVGISGDASGHLIGDKLLIAFGAPYGLDPQYNNDCTLSHAPLCWGHWDLYGIMFPFDKLSITGKALTTPGPATISQPVMVGDLTAPAVSSGGLSEPTATSNAVDLQTNTGFTSTIETFVPPTSTDTAPSTASKTTSAWTDVTQYPSTSNRTISEATVLAKKPSTVPTRAPAAQNTNVWLDVTQYRTAPSSVIFKFAPPPEQNHHR